MVKVRRFEGPSTILRKIKNARKYRIYHQAIESINELCLPHFHPENRNIIAVVYELVANSTVELKNVDPAIAKKLLWFTSTEEERKSRSIDHLASVRICSGGRRPTLNGFLAGNQLCELKTNRRG